MTISWPTVAVLLIAIAGLGCAAYFKLDPQVTAALAGLAIVLTSQMSKMITGAK